VWAWQKRQRVFRFESSGDQPAMISSSNSTSPHRLGKVYFYIFHFTNFRGILNGSNSASNSTSPHRLGKVFFLHIFPFTHYSGILNESRLVSTVLHFTGTVP
jgi:hypothetical protein